MSRFSLRPLAVALFALVGVTATRAEIDSVRYLIPVTYDMVISRVGSTSSTTVKGITTEKASPSFEIFSNKDILKLILAGSPDIATTDAELKKWSLFAVGNSETFTAADLKGLETLELVARKKTTAGERVALPSGMSFSLSLSSTRAYSSSAIHDDSATGPVLSRNESIVQLATLTQALPSRGNLSAGTLTTTGYLSHGLVNGKVTIGGESAGTITRPTAVLYQASGTFNAANNGEDGLAEVQIRFGNPALEAIATTAQ